MPPKLVEQSPFRFAAIDGLKNDLYRVGNISPQSGTAHSLAASARFVAVPVGAGNINILPVDAKEYKRTDRPSVVNAHPGGITDLAFSPHDDFVLAATGPSSLKIFRLPAEGVTADIATADKEVTGLSTPFCLQWHPSAENVLAIGGKNALYVIDTGAGEIKYQWAAPGFGNDIVSVCWNADGSQLAAVNKKGLVSVGDPREAKEDFLTAGTNIAADQHQPQWVQFWTNKEGKSKLVVMGLDKQRKPVVTFWGSEQPVGTITKNTLSFSSGLLLQLYDPDTDLLYLTVRGSSSVSIYDVSETRVNGIPKFTCLSTANLDQAAKGLAFMAKRGVDTFRSEINRLYVVGPNGVAPHAIKVPRKTPGFATELYPHTRDAKAALSALDFFAGNNAAPLRVDMQAPWTNTPWRAGTAEATPTGAALAVTVSSPRAGAAPAAAAATVASPRAGAAVAASPKAVVMEKKTEKRAELEKSLAVSAYKHLTLVEPDGMDKKSYWFDAKVGVDVAAGANISANDKYYAIQWATLAGSAIAVVALDPTRAKGRFTTKPHCVRGLREQVTTYALNQFDQDLIISGNAEGKILVQRIPDGGLTADLTSVESTFSAPGKVTRLLWHPAVADVFISVCERVGATPIVSFWDLKTGEARKEYDFFEDSVMDVALAANCRSLAVSSKDGKVRVIDVVEGRVTKTIIGCAEIKRDCRVVWLNADRLVTVGFGDRSARSLSLWDLSGDEPQHLFKHQFQVSNAMLLPWWDADSKVLMVGHLGGSSIDIFQLSASTNSLEVLNTVACNSDLRGMHFFHKTTVDVTKVEILRSIRVGKTSVVPISWTLPRKRKEFFQDDVYPDTAARTPLFASADAFFEWDGSTVVTPALVSLNPNNMALLSTAPPEALTERQLKYHAQVKKMETPDEAGKKAKAKIAEVLADADDYTSVGNRFDAKPSRDNDDIDWGDDVSD